MNVKSKKIVITIGVALVLLVAGIVVSYEYFLKEEEKKEIKENIIEVDNQISPYTNQGIIVEILRIRHRGLLDKMLTFGTSWKDSPGFFYIVNVDGKECNCEGNVGTCGVYTDWDTFGEESAVGFHIEEEQETSDVTISIIEQTTSGLLFKKKQNIEQEKIKVKYDFRTGRWRGRDDSFMDSDGYGHYVGETFEVWFNIYQMDYDHDDIPYWTEVNVLGTDPTIDDSELDPDEDGIPTSWEWRWNYDPFVWNDHKNLDPDIDGIQNVEEYQMRKRLADPYQPDMYIETDGMEKKGLIDLQHTFFKESQQMIIERFCQHGINVYIDDGWPDSPVNGGGEILPFHVNLEDVTGKQMLKFYEHNFPDDRKGIFRYLISGYKYSGFLTTCDYNKYDTMQIGNNIKDTFMIRKAFSKRTIRLTYACNVLHELGHSLGLMPRIFPGIDIIGPTGARYPSMEPEDYESYQEHYEGVMNYKYVNNKKLFDYSDGSNGAPYDLNDWAVLYLPYFEIDDISYEETIDETFEDFEVSDEYPGVIVRGWEHDENLTEKYSAEFKNLALVKNAEIVEICVYRKIDEVDMDENNIRVYAMPIVEPVHSIWSLVAEGKTDLNDDITIYSIQDKIQEINSLI
jgi:hypothetical protein